MSKKQQNKKPAEDEYPEGHQEKLSNSIAEIEEEEKKNQENGDKDNEEVEKEEEYIKPEHEEKKKKSKSSNKFPQLTASEISQILNDIGNGKDVQRNKYFVNNALKKKREKAKAILKKQEALQNEPEVIDDDDDEPEDDEEKDEKEGDDEDENPYLNEKKYPDKILFQLFHKLNGKSGSFKNRPEYAEIAKAAIERDMIDEDDVPKIEKKIKECLKANKSKIERIYDDEKSAKRQKLTRSNSIIIPIPKGTSQLTINFE